MTSYPHLFAPGRIGRLALRNRIVMAPMEKNLADPTGAVTQRYVDYCELLMSRLVPGRAELAGLAAYLASAADRAGVALRRGVETDAQRILAEHPDAVVVATGARPSMPPIPGIADSPADDPFDVLRRAAGGVRRALVVGGGVLGVGIAHVLAERGVDVIVTEPGDELAGELGLRPRWRFVADLRARPNVTIYTRTTVEELYADGARLGRDGEAAKLRALDLVVPTRPMVPVRGLVEALAARAGGPPVHEIGDCLAPRTAFEAMQEAATLGHRL